MDMITEDNKAQESVENWSKISNIRQVRIGDTIRDAKTQFPMYVVGVLAEPGTLGVQPADYTGIIYGDFNDNPADVWEYDLAKDSVERLEQA